MVGKVKVRRWTDEALKKLRPNPGTNDSRFLIERGLYLRVRTNEVGTVSRHWEYRAQVAGQRRRLAIGEYPTISYQKARADLDKHESAQEAAKRGEGDHPVIAARFARKEASEQLTVAALFDEWVADKRLGSARKGGKPVRQRSIDVLTENFDADIRGRIGDARVAKLTREALQACIDAPRKRGAPGAASHVYRTLRGLINFATARGYIDGADPMRGIENPKPYRPAPVNAATDAEIITMLQAVDGSGLWAATKLAIEFELLTGARPGEVRLATWKEIDAKRAVWTIPADRVKSGREFALHLSPQSLEVLKRARLLGGKVHVFPGMKGQEAEEDRPMEKMAVARALSRLAARKDGTKKLRPHDLRRTFRTMLSRLGVLPHVAELCMNHQETETMRRVYDGHSYAAEVISAWDKAGAHIASLRASGAQVIPIESRRSSA